MDLETTESKRLCEMPLVHQDQFNGYAGLNEDLWLRILGHLDYRDLHTNCAVVCHTWASWIPLLTGKAFCHRTHEVAEADEVARIIRYIARRAQTLESIDLACYISDSDLDRIVSLMEQCPRLRHLTLEHAADVEEDLPDSVSSRLPTTLQSAKLVVSHQDVLPLLQRLKNLRQLEVLATSGEFSGLEQDAINAMPELKALDIVAHQDIADQAFNMARGGFKYLSQLTLSDACQQREHSGTKEFMRVGTDVLDAVMHSTNLKKFRLMAFQIEVDDEWFQPADWKRLEQHSSLQEIHMHVGTFCISGEDTPEDLAALFTLPQLTELSIRVDVACNWMFEDMDFRGSQLQKVAICSGGEYTGVLSLYLGSMLYIPTLQYLELLAVRNFDLATAHGHIVQLSDDEGEVELVEPNIEFGGSDADSSDEIPDESLLSTPFMVVMALNLRHVLRKSPHFFDSMSEFFGRHLERVRGENVCKQLPLGFQPEAMLSDLNIAPKLSTHVSRKIVYCNEAYANKFH